MLIKILKLAGDFIVFYRDADKIIYGCTIFLILDFMMFYQASRLSAFLIETKNF